ncbi:MAG: hypothetical protein ACXWIM_17680, partial [Burkholderiales bacterium]
MIAVLILVVGALLFLVRFLVAICGRDGNAPHIAYLAQVAPDGPAGGEDDEDGRILAVQAATLTHRSLVPIHVRHGEQRRT